MDKNNEEKTVKIGDKGITLDNKKKGIILIAIGIILIILVILCSVLIKTSSSESDKLSKKLENMGKDFYENFYYEQVGSTDEERATFVSEYESIGIKINLDNLSRNSDENKKLAEEFINSKTNKKCDTSNTKVTIYPQKPYGKTDYKIETTLDCGFDEEK